MEIKRDLTSVNFTAGGLRQVRGLVIHSMGGFYQGSINWFKNPNAEASAHYLISKDGEITQCVLDEDMAWHAGFFDEPLLGWLKPNPNFWTLSLEFEDCKNKDWPYPQAQREAGRWLVKRLIEKYQIPYERIVLHRDLNPSRRTDPVGDFSFSWLLGNMGGGETMEITKQLFNKLVNEGTQWGEVADYLGLARDDAKGGEKAVAKIKDLERMVVDTSHSSNVDPGASGEVPSTKKAVVEAGKEGTRWLVLLLVSSAVTILGEKVGLLPKEYQEIAALVLTIVGRALDKYLHEKEATGKSGGLLRF